MVRKNYFYFFAIITHLDDRTFLQNTWQNDGEKFCALTPTFSYHCSFGGETKDLSEPSSAAHFVVG